MTEEFTLSVATIEYKITAEFDEAGKRLRLFNNGELVSDKKVNWRLNCFFSAIVLDGENVVFVCLERRYSSLFDRVFKRTAEFYIDLFVDNKSIKDSSSITRAKDKAVEQIEHGFVNNMVRQLKWTAPLSVAIVAVPQLISILTDRFKNDHGYFLYFLLLFATACVWVLLFTALSWLRLAVIEEQWDKLFD